jgi:hypothetical protein
VAGVHDDILTQLSRIDALRADVLRGRNQEARVATGDLDGAMEDLEVLLGRPGLTTVWELRLDPIYDPLRGRADFQALVAGGA